MKKIIFYLLAAVISIPSLATSINGNIAPPKASEIIIQLEGGKTINMQQLADMSVADFEKFTNRKMKLTDKITFRLGQKKLRDNINPDGSMKNEKIAKTLAAGDYGEGGFHIGGFVLGLLLGLIGVLIAYLINDDNRSRRRKWAWIGLAVYVAAYITLRILLM
jgi:hypothetical protein